MRAVVVAVVVAATRQPPSLARPPSPMHRHRSDTIHAPQPSAFASVAASWHRDVDPGRASLSSDWGREQLWHSWANELMSTCLQACYLNGLSSVIMLVSLWVRAGSFQDSKSSVAASLGKMGDHVHQLLRCARPLPQRHIHGTS